MFGALKPMTKTQKLTHLAAELLRKETFKPGDLVVWKDGMKNKKYPLYGEPFVVTAVLPEPIIDPEATAGNCYFREPLDIKLGLLDADGDFVEHHYDSRRFTLA
ncbi:hypothetical protein [Pseudomonas kuykendallii]|uniref:hypothetical protein n=1 Tax=Pseudomonas kuykendallii TaxID=1007099 RepID=UPI0028D12124|nr:hypothetical protein [Pseudomonas kuykendallii]